jgi:dolichyl-phosphate-mannose--protein O-mannosyl transferase
MEFCLENRSPQVKRLLFENAYMLVALYAAEIQYLDEYLYLTLAEEIRALERYEERVVVWFLKFFNALLSSLLV